MTSQYLFPHIYHLELELTEYQGIGQYLGSQSCSQPRSTFAKRRLSFSLQRLQLQILPGAPKKGQGDNLSRSKAPLHGCCADPRPGSAHLRRAWSRRFRWPGVTAINNNYNNKITKIIGNNNKQVATWYHHSHWPDPIINYMSPVWHQKQCKQQQKTNKQKPAIALPVLCHNDQRARWCSPLELLPAIVLTATYLQLDVVLGFGYNMSRRKLNMIMVMIMMMMMMMMIDMEEAFFSFTSESTARQSPVMELEIVPPTGGLEIGQILSSFNFYRLNIEKEIGSFFMHENIIHSVMSFSLLLCWFLGWVRASTMP